jgi:L,D-peptidoglycan transpeptidase YkuD (ErfK/YbiS/YcfS/YnhG family)
MSDIQVISADTLIFNGKHYRCAIGRSGFETGDRREGSGTTPRGRFALRECWYRADRITPPKTNLPLRVIRQDDGWCDDPSHPSYNRTVKLPFAASHEKLWREDNVYDVIVPLGYNDNPVIAGKGSAIFMHLAKPDFSPTEGCVAIPLDDLNFILSIVSTETHIVVA